MTLLSSPRASSEITAFTIAVQGAGYLVAMFVANLMYGLGSICEEIVRPRNPARWRSVAFTLGTAFSVVLPFSIPLLVALTFSARQ